MNTYTPRCTDHAILTKNTNDTTLTIQGQIESVLENSKHGLSVRFEGLETYIHIDSNTTIRKVEN